MKFIKYITLVFLTGICFWSCSDDIELRQASEGVNEGYLKVSFGIAEEEHIVTRGEQNSSEKLINNLTLLIFNAEGTELLMRDDLDESVLSSFDREENNTFDYTLKLDKPSLSGKVYAVANTVLNSGDLIASFIPGATDATVAKLEEIISSQSYDQKNGHFMSGIGSITDNSTSIDLVRSSAKLTLKDESNNKNFELLGFAATGIADYCYLTAGASTSNKIYSGSSKKRIEAYEDRKVKNGDGTFRYDVYVNPTIAHSVSDGETTVYTYVIIKGEYEGKEGYYAVALYNSADQRYYDINPNTWYEMQITDVKGPGYETQEIALANPSTSLVTVDIHDHVYKVKSITTDGIRSLASDREVRMSSSMISQDEGYILTLKCYSKNESEIPSSAPKAMVEQEDQWLSVSGGTETTNFQTTGSHDDFSDGKIFEYKLWINDESKIITDKQAVVKFEWMGLSREIPVYYSADFKPEEMCNVTLHYINIGSSGSPKESENNYWSFIKETLKGAGSEDMAEGVIRNEGFHFPMPYGTSTKWGYKYEVDFSISNDNSNPLQDVTAKPSGDSFFLNDNLSWSFNTSTLIGTLELSNPSATDYTYATGSITFRLKYEDETESVLTIDLYHTGFFHEDGGNTLYYEVVSLGNDHWLDRNLGATSNKMYVKYENTQYGKAEAAGKYYKVADYGGYTAKIPETREIKILNSEVCPPGYHVPSSTEWDRVRQSPNFVSERITDETTKENYYTTYYESIDKDTGKKIGKIYFPKARFHNETTEMSDGVKLSTDVNSGSDATGYYWTCTESSGQEKIQIGKWLRALTISGLSNTYINGSINNHMMNVRCMAGDKAPEETKYSIEFNVKGATHAYLYTVDESTGNKSGIFSFPGKSIGSAGAVRDLNGKESEYLHFSYRSNHPATSLYVFFAYMNEDGKIMVIYNNGSQTFTHENVPDEIGFTTGASVMTSAKFDMDAIKGWPVWIGANYNFIWDEGKSYGANEDLTNLTSIRFYKDKFKDPIDMRIYWPKVKGNSIFIDTNSIGSLSKTGTYGDYFYYSDFSSIPEGELIWSYYKTTYSSGDLKEFSYDADSGRYCGYINGTNVRYGLPTGVDPMNNRTTFEFDDILYLQWSDDSDPVYISDTEQNWPKLEATGGGDGFKTQYYRVKGTIAGSESFRVSSAKDKSKYPDYSTNFSDIKDKLGKGEVIILWEKK